MSGYLGYSKSNNAIKAHPYGSVTHTIAVQRVEQIQLHLTENPLLSGEHYKAFAADDDNIRYQVTFDKIRHGENKGNIDLEYYTVSGPFV